MSYKSLTKSHTPYITCYNIHKVFKSHVKSSQATSCTLQQRTPRGYLLPISDSSSLNRTNSVTYIAEERTRITGSTCHVTTTHRCVASPRTRGTPPPVFLRVGSCLQSCCLATLWSNQLQYSTLWVLKADDSYPQFSYERRELTRFCVPPVLTSSRLHISVDQCTAWRFKFCCRHSY
jgi:hypothetical protein